MHLSSMDFFFLFNQHNNSAYLVEQREASAPVWLVEFHVDAGARSVLVTSDDRSKVVEEISFLRIAERRFEAAARIDQIAPRLRVNVHQTTFPLVSQYN